MTDENANPVFELAFLISGSGKTHTGGHLIPGSAFQSAPGSFYSSLFEKERDSRPQALIADFGHPARLGRTRPRDGFFAVAAYNCQPCRSPPLAITTPA
jgi:hypothetical protein